MWKKREGVKFNCGYLQILRCCSFGPRVKKTNDIFIIASNYMQHDVM